VIWLWTTSGSKVTLTVGKNSNMQLTAEMTSSVCCQFWNCQRVRKLYWSGWAQNWATQVQMTLLVCSIMESQRVRRLCQFGWTSRTDLTHRCKGASVMRNVFSVCLSQMKNCIWFIYVFVTKGSNWKNKLYNKNVYHEIRYTWNTGNKNNRNVCICIYHSIHKVLASFTHLLQPVIESFWFIDTLSAA